MRGTPAGGGGCGLAGIIGLLVVVAVVAFLVLPLSFCSAPYHADYSSASSVSVPANTVAREALPLDAAEQTQLYEDADGTWIANPTVVEAGLREFWLETGVYPYLYIAPNGSLTSGSACHELAASLYDELFDDSAHMVLVFCDDGSGGFYYGYETGSQAQTVMDDAAVQTLVAYLERYYDTAPTEDQMFADAYLDTAKTIMHVEEPLAQRLVPVIVIAVVAIAVVAIVYVVYKRKKERDEHVREVLERPLEKFGDQELEDLEKKYEDKL